MGYILIQVYDNVLIWYYKMIVLYSISLEIDYDHIYSIAVTHDLGFNLDST